MTTLPPEQPYSISYMVWHLPKIGDPEAAYQDSYAPKEPMERKSLSAATRFAVADGVSGAYFSRRWADLLTSSYVEEGIMALSPSSLSSLAAVWTERELQRITEIYGGEEDEEILQESLQEYGGSATFHGLELNDSTNEWMSVSIGDACVFQIRNSAIYTQVPPLSADEFDDYPNQLSTLFIPEHEVPAGSVSGTFQIGDTFLLATDCFALWLVQEHASVSFEQKLQAVLSLKTQSDFEEFIRTEQSDGRMGDDDITVSIIHIMKSQMQQKMWLRCRSCWRPACIHYPLQLTREV